MILFSTGHNKMTLKMMIISPRMCISLCNILHPDFRGIAHWDGPTLLPGVTHTHTLISILQNEHSCMFAGFFSPLCSNKTWMTIRMLMNCRVKQFISPEGRLIKYNPFQCVLNTSSNPELETGRSQRAEKLLIEAGGKISTDGFWISI